MSIKDEVGFIKGMFNAVFDGDPRPEFAPPPPPPIANTEHVQGIAGQSFGGGAPRPKPEPIPATKQLRTNLERVTLAYNDRERVLVKEITEREAELADVRRARDATTAALMELDLDGVEVYDAATGGLAGETVDPDIDAAQVAAMSDGPPWMAQMADPQHRDIYAEAEANAMKYGGARYVPLDEVMHSTSGVTSRLPHD